MRDRFLFAFAEFSHSQGRNPESPFWALMSASSGCGHSRCIGFQTARGPSGSIEIIICEVGFNKEDNQHTFFIDVFNYLSGFGYRLCEIQDQVAYKQANWGAFCQ
jgi:hypothetical protein